MSDTNWYGRVTVMWHGERMPIMCGCGGSMYCCERHATEWLAAGRAEAIPLDRLVASVAEQSR